MQVEARRAESLAAIDAHLHFGSPATARRCRAQRRQSMARSNRHSASAARAAGTCSTAPSSSAKQAAIGSAASAKSIASRNAGERHFQQRHQHSAVRAVVIGEQQAAILQFAQRGEQRRQQLRAVEIRRLAAALAVHLRPAEPPRRFLPAPRSISSSREAATGPTAASASRAHRHRREGRNDQRHRRRTECSPARVAPRVRIDRNPCRPGW
jgi:hypothetical protein